MISRISVLVLGIAALLLALYKTSVYELMVDSWSILLATLFVPLTAGLWWKRANAQGAIMAIATGFVSWLLFLAFFPQLPGDLLAVPFAVITIVIGSLFSSQQPRPLTDADGCILSNKKRLGLP